MCSKQNSKKYSNKLTLCFTREAVLGTLAVKHIMEMVLIQNPRLKLAPSTSSLKLIQASQSLVLLTGTPTASLYSGPMVSTVIKGRFFIYFIFFSLFFFIMDTHHSTLKYVSCVMRIDWL